MADEFKKVYLLIGTKDELGKKRFVKKINDISNKGVQVYKYTDPLMDVVNYFEPTPLDINSLNINSDKYFDIRKFISDLKEITDEYYDFCYNKFMETYNDFMKSPDEILFVDMERYNNDIERMFEDIDAETLLFTIENEEDEEEHEPVYGKDYIYEDGIKITLMTEATWFENQNIEIGYKFNNIGIYDDHVLEAVAYEFLNCVRTWDDGETEVDTTSEEE